MGKKAAPASASLENTYWKLVELQGEEIVTPAGRREAHLMLLPEEKRVQGFGGCNGFFGSYELEGDRLGFGPIGATRMACPDTGDMEMAFFRVLGPETTFTIDGETLELMSPDGTKARFETASPE
jgi:heat shock protein HslJ